MSAPRPLTPTSSFYLKVKDQNGADYWIPIADGTKTVGYAKELLRKLTRMYVQKLEVKDGEEWRELDNQKTLVDEGVGEDSDVLAQLFTIG